MISNYREWSSQMKVVYRGGEGEIVEKKSRFICTVKPITSEDEAIEFVAEMKKKYWDARHNCMVYVLGDKYETARFSDDGEPQGTAGKPMLDVLMAKDIHNVVVVVTRYFGGVLLGTGGLIRAYQGSLIEGLNNSVIIEKHKGVKYSVKSDYADMGKIQYIVNTEGYYLRSTEYGQDVQAIIVVEKDDEQAFVNKLTEATAARAELEKIDDIDFALSEQNEYIDI